MTIKAAAAEQDDEKKDEKDVHVWLQCDETTLAGAESSMGVGAALAALNRTLPNGSCATF